MQSNEIQAVFEFQGYLEGHNGEVTQIVAGNATQNSSQEDDMILVSGSRDHSLIIWSLNEKGAKENQFGLPLKQLTGHNHFVTDLSISQDNFFVISSSWDKTLRLWNLRSGKCQQQFVKHTKEVNTVTFSQDNRQIFSAGFEHDLRLWNTQAEFKLGSTQNSHQDWVSRVRYSQSAKNNYYASVGWDGRLKLWDGIFKLRASIKAHENPIYALALAKNGQYIATGGKDQEVKIWNFPDMSKPAFTFQTNGNVNDLAFNTNLQWVAAACDNSIKIWDLTKENQQELSEIYPESREEGKEGMPVISKATSITWSANSRTLYVGCADGVIRVYSVRVKNAN